VIFHHIAGQPWSRRILLNLFTSDTVLQTLNHN